MLDTLGHILQTEDHAVGFFKCNNKLKLVDNDIIINFNYYNFIDLIIRLKNKDVGFKICNCLYNENENPIRLGFIIYVDNKNVIYYFTEETLGEYNYNYDNKKEDENNIFIDNYILSKNFFEIENILTYKLNYNFKKKISRNDNIRFNKRILLTNSILFNDYDLFDYIYNYNFYDKNNKISVTLLLFR